MGSGVGAGVGTPPLLSVGAVVWVCGGGEGEEREGISKGNEKCVWMHEKSFDYIKAAGQDKESLLVINK